ncbi:hydroxyisourate hydrolase [Agromyces mangrovi Wang et al. 2018]|uniref:hydroxyisourate hydrolase n=1 Tax=Agromyces mangrovi TaxID=1858653 RepID=UPI0025722C6B|nr:hydroxyisourate hydrolase [Agromyces mangrovi]BDZ63683.1 5-hydroxyisourate hydrolase [Agromyces mangrovi]
MNAGRSHVTSHVLDAGTGRPAAGVGVRLEASDAGTWHEVGAGVTDDDGRVGSLGPAQLPAGRYRVVFDTAAYFGDRPTFYAEVTIDFLIDDPAQHYHVPLLLSPFAYSTYRGS